MKNTIHSSFARDASSRLYTMKVTLIEGPISKDFALRNPEVSRTIRMGGGATLSDLHRAIYGAFDRTMDRPYEFQFDRSPSVSGHLCYGIPEHCRDIYGDPIHAGDASATALDTLGIKAGDSFGYWFDFAEIWLHRIDVLDITGDKAHAGPEVIERVGESPSPLPRGDMLFRS